MNRAATMLSALGAAVLAGGALLDCAPDEPLDHLWDYDRCAVEVDSAIAWDPTGPANKVKASALLRREGGAEALVVELGAFGHVIGDPYPSGATVRFAVPPGARGPAQLSVAVDASDVRGPLVVAPGTGWLIATDRVDTSAPEDGWKFGRGTMQLESLSLTEEDSSERDDVTLEATFDLSGVSVAPLSASDGAGAGPSPVAGRVRIRCVDTGTPALGAAGSGGAAGSSGAAGAGDQGGGGSSGNQGGQAGSGGVAGSPSSCGSASPCEGTQVVVDAALSVAVGPFGIGWLDGSPTPGAHFWPTDGEPAELSPHQETPADRMVIDGGELFWTSYTGLWTTSVPGGAPMALAVATAQPDGLRLLGVTASHVYYMNINEGSAFDVIRRIDRATLDNTEVVACAPIGTYDATLQASTGAVLVASGAKLTRFDQALGGASCGAPTSGSTIMTVGPGEAIWRVVAGPTMATVIVQAASGYEVRSLPVAGGASSVLGHAATFTAQSMPSFPLAMDGDTAFWVDAQTMGPMAWRIVASGAAQPSPVATTHDTVLGLAVSPTTVVWADASGVFRAAR